MSTETNTSPDSESFDREEEIQEVQKLFNRRKWLKTTSMSALGVAGAGIGYYYWAPPAMPTLRFDGTYAYAGQELPPAVQHVVRYANEILGRPYERGGGHQKLFDEGFDCSGAISHVLFRAGLLQSPQTSAGFARYGQSGPGKYITLFVKPGEHVFMSVCGLRFDTTGGRAGEGPRWRASPRDPSGFVNRHPAGL
jgi:hypothetical protein